MYIRSHDGLENKELPLTYSSLGLSDGLETWTGISTALIYKLADLVFFARYPKLVGTKIIGNRNLELEYKKIYKQLLNPSSVSLPTGFEIKLTVPSDPQPDYSKTADELGVWESAIFGSGPYFKFATDKIIMPNGRSGSFVDSLSVIFNNPKFVVFIAKHLKENSHDPGMETRDRNAWGQILHLVRKHAYVHLDIYRHTAENLEKVFKTLFGKLLLLPTVEKPLAVSKDKLDEYLIRLGEFLTSIIDLEFWEKTCVFGKRRTILN